MENQRQRTSERRSLSAMHPTSRRQISSLHERESSLEKTMTNARSGKEIEQQGSSVRKKRLEFDRTEDDGRDDIL